MNDIKLLLVEDHDDFLELMKMYLEKQGIKVTSAGSAVEALKLYQDNNNYDVVFSDICMANMDGFELLVRIRRINKNQPIILTSGNPSQDYIDKAKELCANHFLKKPYHHINDILSPIYTAVKEYRKTKRSV